MNIPQEFKNPNSLHWWQNFTERDFNLVKNILIGSALLFLAWLMISPVKH
jgi:hypothetical protein